MGARGREGEVWDNHWIKKVEEREEIVSYMLFISMALSLPQPPAPAKAMLEEGGDGRGGRKEALPFPLFFLLQNPKITPGCHRMGVDQGLHIQCHVMHMNRKSA